MTDLIFALGNAVILGGLIGMIITSFIKMKAREPEKETKVVFIRSNEPQKDFMDIPDDYEILINILESNDIKFGD